MTDTQEQFIEAATELFAERGFYGVSLTNVADELGLTKQALLHHFGSKEKLYGAVLGRLSQRFMAALEASKGEGRSAEAQLIAFFRQFSDQAVQLSRDLRLVQRELLDNRQRAEQAEIWYLKPFLDALIGLVQQTDGWRRATDAQALALIYQYLGAVDFFATSEVTLTRMFGARQLEETRAVYGPELIRSLSDRINAGPLT